MSPKFFSFKGKSLDAFDKNLKLLVPIIKRERVSTLFDEPNQPIFQKELLWQFALGVVTLFLILSFFIFQVPIAGTKKGPLLKYSVFSSKPLVLDKIDYDIGSVDSKAERVDSVFEFYKCPIAGQGNVFVQKAEENDLPYWLLAAMSFQESGCGKNTPKIKGSSSETYNLFGWGVWGDKVYKFDGYEQAIDIVSKYMNKKFYSKGITDLCEIMQTYTPPSDGSWCNGVQYFGDVIQNYKSPKI